MNFERYSEEDWPTSCAISGINIPAGTAVRLVVIDYDYNTGEEGPCALASPMTWPMPGVYTGGGITEVPSQGEYARAAEQFFVLSGLEPRVGGTGGYAFRNGLRADRHPFVILETVWRGLEDLDSGEAGGKKLGQIADERRAAMRKAFVPHCGSEAAGRTADYQAVREQWEKFRRGSESADWDWPDIKGTEGWLDSEASMDEALGWERDAHLLWILMANTGKIFTSHERHSYASNSAVVADLARLVRRKAVAAASHMA